MKVTAIYVNHKVNCHYLQVDNSDIFLPFGDTDDSEILSSIKAVEGPLGYLFTQSTKAEIESEEGSMDSPDFEQITYLI